MPQDQCLPVELLIDIADYLRPQTPTIGHDAAWSKPKSIQNWWDAALRTINSTETSRNANRESGKEGNFWLSEAATPYASLLNLRQVNGEFNQICIPLLYHDFSLLTDSQMDRDVASEIVTRYSVHFRTVRLSMELGISWEEIFTLLTPQLSERVTSLGVYFVGGRAPNVERWDPPVDVIFTALEKGQITSFGIYSTTAFSGDILPTAPPRVASLLDRITPSYTGLDRLISLDIVIDRMGEKHYDILRTKIVHLGSLTIRAALQEDLDQMWSINEQNKWYPCHNLTNLQLLHCTVAYAPHIPEVLRFFPALRILFIAGCGDNGDIVPPGREKGWSRRNDALWVGRSPLQSMHLECMYEWEVAAMGVVHTESLIITAMLDDGDSNDSFADEEIFPDLRVLQVEPDYLSVVMARVCKQRGIVVKSDAKALVFPRKSGVYINN